MAYDYTKDPAWLNYVDKVNLAEDMKKNAKYEEGLARREYKILEADQGLSGNYYCEVMFRGKQYHCSIAKFEKYEYTEIAFFLCNKRGEPEYRHMLHKKYVDTFSMVTLIDEVHKYFGEAQNAKV